MTVVSLATTMLVAVVPPKVTALVPVRLVPVMVTDVPPLPGPVLGVTVATVGVVAGLRAIRIPPLNPAPLSVAEPAPVEPATTIVAEAAPVVHFGSVPPPPCVLS